VTPKAAQEWLSKQSDEVQRTVREIIALAIDAKSCSDCMKKSELQDILSALPDYPVIFKVAQDMFLDDSYYAWVRGELSRVKVEELYLDRDDKYVDREDLRASLYDTPEAYGLPKNLTEDEVEQYLNKIKETYVVIEVQ
jgi:hypothetical protein